MNVKANTILLIAILREFAKVPSNNACAWIVRTRHDRIEITHDRGVKAAATWWISRVALAELLWDRDVTLPLPDALDDPDEAVKIAAYVLAYEPPALRRWTGPMRQAPPI